jgi:hypothetical protein
MIKGVVFDEPFFDAVIQRAGGCRLTDLHTPPAKKQHVDYLIRGFLLELKILMSDPLDAQERQASIEKFLRSELPKGPLWVTPTRRSITLAGQQAKDYWERIMGKPIQDRLDSAAGQIRDTLTFVPGSWKGGVIIVNSAGPSFDWQSFTHLADHYHERFSEINAVFAMNGVPAVADGKLIIHFATIAKGGHRPEADALGILLDTAIREEIEKRTKRTLEAVEVDPHAASPKAAFQITPTGVRKKHPSPPGS